MGQIIAKTWLSFVGAAVVGTIAYGAIMDETIRYVVVFFAVTYGTFVAAAVVQNGSEHEPEKITTDQWTLAQMYGRATVRRRSN